MEKPVPGDVYKRQGLDRAHFISAIVDFYERTNELHPFREGNGRTQRVFLSQLALHAGSVSYTHLDVYKRQPRMRATVPRFLFPRAFPADAGESRRQIFCGV